MALVKGSGFLEMRLFLEARGGPDARARMRELPAPPDVTLFEEALALTWCSLDAYVRVMAAVGPALAKSSREGAHELGRFAADFDLSRIQRLFLRLANPAYVLEKTGDCWKRFYDTGKWRVTRESPTRARRALRLRSRRRDVLRVHALLPGADVRARGRARRAVLAPAMPGSGRRRVRVFW